MDPPPRKDVSTALIFRKHQEAQKACFERKHQLELEFLNRFRTYCKHRGEVETEYALNLQKLSSQCQISEHLAHTVGYTNRSLYAIWNSYLHESNKVAKHHDELGKFISVNVSENMKNFQVLKLEAAKMTLEKLSTIHSELQLSAKEVDKTRREYHSACAAHFEYFDKAANLKEKLNKKQFGLFQKNEQVQAEYDKLSTKCDELKRQVEYKRNAYLLAVAALAEHQRHYRAVDMADLGKNLEKGIYEQVWTYLSSMTMIEKDMYMSAKDSLSKMTIEVEQCLSPIEHSEAFMACDKSLTHPVDTHVERHPRDDEAKLILNRDSEAQLNQEGKKWVAAVSRHRRSIEEMEPKLAQLEQLEHQSWESRKTTNSSGTAAGLDDLNRQIEAARETLRKERTMMAKAKVMVEALREVGVRLDELTTYHARNEQQTNAVMTNTIQRPGIHRKTSQLSLRSASSDYGTLGRRYVAVYAYKSKQADELSIDKGEELLVIDNNGDTLWPKAQNARGLEGVVPSNYIEPLTQSNVPAKSDSPQPVRAPVDQLFSPAAKGKGSSNGGSPLHGRRKPLGYCEALLDMEQTGDGELRFRFHDVIAIFDRRPHKVDDGWWSGSVLPSGPTGTFASLMVRELTAHESEERLLALGCDLAHLDADESPSSVTMRPPRPPLAKKPPRSTWYGESLAGQNGKQIGGESRIVRF